VLVLSTQDQPVVRFYVEEGDMDKVAVGDRVRVTFEGYPDLTLEGEVYDLEPTMVIIDSSPTLIAWASLPSDSSVPLFSGMSADVEIISGEARNVLLVPVAALRELAPGSYAVFVVQPDGQLKLTPVKVGLQDLTNAEIVEGLKAGDVISTGNVVTQQ
jgi:multidrug efflux pump subunit AcrA (membrane-fusion protein)